ncbi:beta strand repeat-containing protein, partial [Dolichospermum circinale]|uniref:beta strand repeat-containing protein n=1 Tax=Dolichospermum circinale TaxID=109265 RepID=UPI002330C821
NDTISTGNGDDTINAGLGYDVVDGGTGNDLLILDYFSNTYTGTRPQSGISSSVSLNGNGGFNGSYLAYYNTNYNSDQVNFSNIERFQITGTDAMDNIVTGNGNDTINSGAGNDGINAGGGNDSINTGDGNDSINGGDGNDTIDGVNGASLTPGLGEIDSLTGGAGSDRFILGNATKAYYDDGNTLTNGSNDYADITDFNIGDIIQLQGTSSNYLLAVVGVDTQILINKPGTELDELIGIVRNQTGLSLTGTYFSYVSNVTLPTITLAVSPTSVLEDGATNLVYTFTRTGITTDALTVNYDITGTADSTDYTGATPGTGKTITFAANSATATLTIDPTADTIIESDETVALTLATGTGYLIGTTTAVTGTITNDDTTITLDVSPSSVTEDGTTNLVYTFTRTGITTNALTVNYGITGTANSTDYTGATPGTGKTITFAANSATATLTIDPTADTIIEANETVALTLVAGTGYTLGTTTAVTGTITNDDLLPNINLSTNQTIVEGFTSPQNVTYTVTLTSASSQSITVQYATANGTAIAASDYTSTSGTLTFNPGVTSQVINIPILNDSLSEANEAFTLTLSSPTNANLGTTNTVTTTITDTLSASVTTTLPANVENLTLTGTTAINGTGNAGNNVLTGNSANNTLTGLNGNDTYSFVANSALGIDTITETTTDGIDTITFNGTTVAVNVNLGVTTSQTVNSNLKLILSANNVIENATGGTGNDRLTGNTLNNTLNGGSGNDQLQGLGGDDNLWGGAGNDILNGGIGNDSLWGGLGDDVLTGGVGNDQYLFQSDSVFSTSLGVDYISEFEAGLDQIVLSKATFNAITDLLGQALTDFAVVSDDEFVNASNARIVFSQGTGSLFYNQDGSILGTGTVFEFARLGNPDITLTGSNFSLIA